MDKILFGKRINFIRNESKLTHKQLAKMIGISQIYIQHIQGGLQLPSLNYFVKICNALKICPNYLLQDSLGTNQEVDDIVDCLKLLNPEQLDFIKTTIKSLINKKQEIVI